MQRKYYVQVFQIYMIREFSRFKKYKINDENYEKV